MTAKLIVCGVLAGCEAFVQAQPAHQDLKGAIGKLEAAYNSRDLKAVDRLVAPEFTWGSATVTHGSRAAFLTNLGGYFRQLTTLRVTGETAILKQTASSAETRTTWIYYASFDWYGKPRKTEYKEQTHRWWSLKPSGWAVSRCVIDASWRKGEDGKWGAANTPKYTAMPLAVGTGVGPAPTKTFEALYRIEEQAMSKRDVGAIRALLSKDYSYTDLQGRSHDRDATIKQLADVFKLAKSINYVSNRRLDHWDATSAQVSATSIYDIQIVRSGRLAREIERTSKITQWSLTPLGWKQSRSRMITSEYADALMKWHPFPGSRSLEEVRAHHE